MREDIVWVEEFFRQLDPRGGARALRDELEEDECRWFRKAVEQGVVEVRPCVEGCKLNWDPEHPRRDEFIVPHQPDKVRHFLTVERSGKVFVNREYVPHVGAYARVILGLGYPAGRSSFSLYRTFQRDAVHKTAGQGYETDAEFYDRNGNIHLHLEAKKDATEVGKIVDDISRCQKLGNMTDGVVKELEYVLDIRPRHLWIVGPGSVDPERHVYEVSVEGNDALFRPIDSLPEPPPA